MTGTDFSAVFWKEWKEIVLERSAGALEVIGLSS